MLRSQIALMSVFLLCFSTTIAVFAESPAEAVSRGRQQLRDGDLESAAKTFGQAAAAEPANKEYSAKAEQLRKVLQLRQVLAQELDDGPWTRVARALHSFYRTEKLNDEALKLDRQIHERLKSGLSASILADTLLVLGKNDEVAEVINSLPDSERTLDSDAVRAIALARAGKQGEAIAAADAIKLPEEICAGKAFLLARLNGAVGRNDEAAKYLKKSFESTPPEKLPNFQKAAKNSPDFAKLLADEKYAFLWNTAPKPAAQEHEHKHSQEDGRQHCLGCPSLDQVQDIPVAPKSDGSKDAKPATDR
jgi:tetratricopeptide (TPR) repeat protein